MAPHFTGSKYDAGMSLVEVARRVRKAIKEHYPDIKTSVRKDGGRGLNIRVISCPFPVVNPARHELERREGYRYINEMESPRYTVKAKALLKDLTDLVNTWNYDKSDTMSDYFDVKFYEHVAFDGAMENAEYSQLDAILDAGYVNLRSA